MAEKFDLAINLTIAFHNQGSIFLDRNISMHAQEYAYFYLH